MNVELEEHLSDLAARVPTSGDGVEDLWRRGRRLRRRRQLTSTALTIAILFAGAVTVTGLLDSSTEDADVASASATFLPDRLHTPGKWLEGTDDAGPLGPLSLAMGAERGQLLGSSTIGIVGVSATTGEYRFLDLPDVDDVFFPEAQSLSPDGRFFAYWIPDLRDTENLGVAAGFNVYDTTTGEVRTYLDQGEWGLAPEGFSWTGERLWANYGVIDELRDDGYSSTIVLGSVDLSAPASEFETTSAQNLPVPSPVTEIWIKGDGVMRLGDPDAGQRRAAYPLGEQIDSPSISPDGRYLVGIRANEDPGPVLVGTVPLKAGPVEMEVVDAAPEAYEVVGWRDDQTVWLLALEPVTLEPGLLAYDVSNGRTSTSIELSGNFMHPTFALDVLKADLAGAPQPNWPMSPRITYGAMILLVLAGLAAGWAGWRRRALG